MGTPQSRCERKVRPTRSAAKLNTLSLQKAFASPREKALGRGKCPCRGSAAVSPLREGLLGTWGAAGLCTRGCWCHRDKGALPDTPGPWGGNNKSNEKRGKGRERGKNLKPESNRAKKRSDNCAPGPLLATAPWAEGPEHRCGGCVHTHAQTRTLCSIS